MSWSFSVTAVPKDEFNAAVDAAVATGQDISLPNVAKDVAAAKETLKQLARFVKRDKVGGGCSGHCLQSEESDNWSDSISVNVYGSP